jgi:hypothetical protein
MMEDLYALWLKIPPGRRPPDHYTLLRLPRFCDDLHQIETAAQKQLDVLDRYAIHPDFRKRDACNELMSEVARARNILTHPQKRAAYDATLGAPPKVEAPAPQVVEQEPGLPAWLQRFIERPLAWHAAWAVPIICIVIAAVIWVEVGSSEKPVAPGSVAIARSPVAPKPAASPAPIAPSPSVPVAVESQSPEPAQVQPAPPRQKLFPVNEPTPVSVRAPHVPTPVPVPVPVPPRPSVPTPKEAPAAPPEPSASPAPSLLPVPSATARANAGKLVDEIYAKDIASVKTPAEKSAVARKMIDMGASLDNDLPGRYVLFERAGELAIHAGDLDIAMDAINSAAHQFQIDGLGIKAAALISVAGSLSANQPHQSIEENTNQLIDEALKADRYDVAKSAANAGLLAANAVEDSKWSGQINARLNEINLAQEAFAKLHDARAKFATDPKDPESNTLIGKYECFEKGNWTSGLAMLAIGSDATTKALALAELSHPSEPLKVMEMTDGWWDLAQNLPPAQRLHVMRHAGSLYRRVLSSLTGLRLLEARKRIDGIDSATGRVIDLMPLIDVSQDEVHGHWVMQKEGLLAYGEDETADASRELRIRCHVPDEYDFRIEFTAPKKRVFVEQLLSHAGHVFAWEMGETGFSQYASCYGFNAVDRRVPNRSSLDGPILEAGSSHTSVVKVRKNFVAGYLDGERMVELKTNYSDLNALRNPLVPDRRIGDGLGLGGGAYKAMGSVRFTKIELVEITSVDEE